MPQFHGASILSGRYLCDFPHPYTSHMFPSFYQNVKLMDMTLVLMANWW